MILAQAEGVRAPAGPGFTDAVTFAFGDLAAGHYGFARLGIAEGRLGSALAVHFAGREPVAVHTRGGVDLGAGAEWAALEVAGVRATVEAPLERWRVGVAGDEGDGFALDFAGLAPPAELPDAAGLGTAGYEQLCRVTGTATVGGRQVAIDCFGQRGHQWGAPDWSRLALTRAVGAWLDDGSAVALAAARPAAAGGHDAEVLWGALLGPGHPVPIAEPRVSTTYDGEGRQRRAGLELWVREEDEAPHRAWGEVLCGSTLELGALRLHCAFLRWHMDGRDGVGRYDVVRRA